MTGGVLLPSGTTGPGGTGGGASAGAGGSSATSRTRTQIRDAGADATAEAVIQALTDGQIFFVADTLSAGEINQSRVAMPALSDPDVEDYAEDVIDEHEDARDTLLGLAYAVNTVPEPSSVAEELQRQQNAAVQRLLARGGAVDTVYLSAQVATQTQTLQLLEQLIEAADSEPLQAQLVVLQTIVQGHLDRARELSAASAPQ